MGGNVSHLCLGGRAIPCYPSRGPPPSTKSNNNRLARISVPSRYGPSTRALPISRESAISHHTSNIRIIGVIKGKTEFNTTIRVFCRSNAYGICGTWGLGISERELFRDCFFLLLSPPFLSPPLPSLLVLMEHRCGSLEPNTGLVGSITSRHYTKLPRFQHAKLRILIDERCVPVSAYSPAHRILTVILTYNRAKSISTGYAPSMASNSLVGISEVSLPMGWYALSVTTDILANAFLSIIGPRPPNKLERMDGGQ